jgi:hypothetical protein
MVYIYILKLIDNKYYVGKTNNPIFRINEHNNNNGSEWTKKYHPLSLIECFKGDEFDEDKFTKIYMDKYGIDNVRGGSYCQMELPYYQINALKKELNGANDNCFICGSREHFVNKCDKKICYRCGRIGHLVLDCYATTHIDNKNLNGCYNCGRSDHWKITCNYNEDIYGRKINKGLFGDWF